MFLAFMVVTPDVKVYEECLGKIQRLLNFQCGQQAGFQFLMCLLSLPMAIERRKIIICKIDKMHDEKLLDLQKFI